MVFDRALRLTAVSAVLLAMWLMPPVSRAGEPQRPREPLAQFPFEVDGWHARRSISFDARTLRILGADDYIDRSYVSSGPSIDFYVGYYASQREGDLIHSPLNCLPGAGWQPVEQARITLPASMGGLAINRLVVEKDEDRQAVLYWYQGRGRVVASEYASRFYLGIDAFWRHRTDGALVRVMTPVAADGESFAEHRLREFVGAVFPLLNRFIPA